jgi:hypothetical protein
VDRAEKQNYSEHSDIVTGIGAPSSVTNLVRKPKQSFLVAWNFSAKQQPQNYQDSAGVDSGFCHEW